MNGRIERDPSFCSNCEFDDYFAAMGEETNPNYAVLSYLCNRFRDLFSPSDIINLRELSLGLLNNDKVLYFPFLEGQMFINLSTGKFTYKECNIKFSGTLYNHSVSLILSLLRGDMITLFELIGDLNDFIAKYELKHCYLYVKNDVEVDVLINLKIVDNQIVYILSVKVNDWPVLTTNIDRKTLNNFSEVKGRLVVDFEDEIIDESEFLRELVSETLSNFCELIRGLDKENEIDIDLEAIEIDSSLFLHELEGLIIRDCDENDIGESYKQMLVENQLRIGYLYKYKSDILIEYMHKVINNIGYFETIHSIQTRPVLYQDCSTIRFVLEPNSIVDKTNITQITSKLLSLVKQFNQFSLFRYFVDVEYTESTQEGNLFGVSLKFKTIANTQEYLSNLFLLDKFEDRLVGEIKIEF